MDLVLFCEVWGMGYHAWEYQKVLKANLERKVMRGKSTLQSQTQTRDNTDRREKPNLAKAWI